MKQGDTVMLTIRGKDIPQGSLVVEFFPEQIAVLSILASDPSSVSVQVRVPKLAPAGPYNVLVYNQLGQEAFGQGILTVVSDLITPVFRDYDPKAIGEASNGFALILTGDSITPDVVTHLGMKWELDGTEVKALKSSFSYGGPGMIVCAVAGKPPGGVLRGTVLLEGTPIYLVELTIKAGQAMIVGHAPASMPAGQATYSVRLLGTGFTADYLSRLVVKLVNGGTTVVPSKIALLDSASVGLEFPGPLPEGQFQLTVINDKELAYEGALEVTAAAPAGAGTVETPTGEQPGAPAEGAPVASSMQASAWIIAVTPLLIEGGGKPNAFFASGKNLTPEIVERLVLSLKFDEQECALQFIGAASSGFTCVFNPPGPVWPPGANGTLSISDPQSQLEQYSIAVFVAEKAPEAPPVAEQPRVPAEPAPAAPEPEPEPAAAAPPEPAPPAEPEQPAAKWQAQDAHVEQAGSAQTLIVRLAAPSANVDPQALAATFTILPTSADLVRDFTGYATSGTLAIEQSGDGWIGTCSGQFPAGDLLVSLAYASAPAQVTVLSLDAPPPAVEVSAPASLALSLAADGVTLEPEELRWELDFGALAPQTTMFLMPVYFPQPQDPSDACSFELHGSRITAVLHPRAWDSATLPVAGITFSLDATIALKWSAEPSFVLPLQNASLIQTPTDSR